MTLLDGDKKNEDIIHPKFSIEFYMYNVAILDFYF